MKIAVVNSRKSRSIHPDERWLQVTMALGYAIAKRGHTLCTSYGTIGYEAALMGAGMAGGKIQAFVSWNDEPAGAEFYPLCTAPNLLSTHVSAHSNERPEHQRDRDVMDAADLVIAVAIRSDGYMESLLRSRFQDGKKVQIISPDQGPLWRGTRNLLEMGVPLLDDELQQLVEECLSKRAMACRDQPDPLAAISSWRDSPLTTPTLAHYTRAGQGPWPGQSRAEYLEDLWVGGWRARRDAWAALTRIVTSATLRASGRLIRQGLPVVSFTAVSPERIAQLHRYRAHLIRWDFEPWGIVFDRDWLISRGARPVKYLPARAFPTLAPDEQPFFQKHEPPGCDYSAEEEWRIVGDLDFSDVPRDAVRLVVF